jgi:predicted RNA binding protein YcfA (HicA-like mRNA interferase family)
MGWVKAMPHKRKPYGTRRITPEKAETLIKLFKKLGYEEHSQRRMRGKGSHVVLRHTEIKKRIVIPMHPGKDVHPELIHGFLKEAGLTRKEYFELLDMV